MRFVYQDEFVNFLNTDLSRARLRRGRTPDLYSASTTSRTSGRHARAIARRWQSVQPQAGRNATYAEIVQRSIDYADAAKDVNPKSKVFGPVNYGWQGFVPLAGCARCT